MIGSWRTALLCGAAALVLAAPAASAADAPAAAGQQANSARLGPFGVDLDGRDLSVKPGDDFFRFAGGTWMKNNPIPADRSSWNSFSVLREESDANVRAIIDELAATPNAKGSIEQKIADYYNAYVDTAGIEAKGLAPAQAGLASIAKAKTHADIAVLMARPDLSLGGPLGWGVGIDAKNPDRYIVTIGQGGLGLPDRDYYLRNDGKFPAQRQAYTAYLERILTLAGEKDAAAAAQSILALETEMAKLHWERAKLRNRDLTYNLKSKAELLALAPDFPWEAAFTAARVNGEQEFVVRQLDAVPQLATLFKATPVAAWKSLLRARYLNANAAVLPKAFDDAVFDFYGKTLSGQPEQRERWKRSVAAVNGALGEAVGQVYVQRHFPPQAKAEMVALVENLRKGYAKRIQGLDWMSADTKKVALEKLAAFRPKIGYPDVWEDYSALEVKPGDAFGNAVRARVWAYNDQVARLGKPTDREQWFMTPQTVNAYYNAQFNEIVFPAAILQPPFFDLHADPAVNYGAIGGVIGHEMGHGFDDQGAKSDAKGVLRSWWSEADVQSFQARTGALAQQYNGYKPLPDQAINGTLTLGENIGDLGGLQVAYEAYKLSLGGREAPVINGLTGDQRFFLGWAQVWRTLFREEALRQQLLTDPHSPGEYRVNGVVPNLDAWYAAFDVKPGDAMYIPPEKRVRIW
jgi:putative endopeptidase